MRETTKLLKDNLNHSQNNMGSISNGIHNNNDSKMNPSTNIADCQHLYWLYATLLFCMGTFYAASISRITDVLQRELSITSSDIGLMSSTFGLTYWLFQFPSGILLQNYSHHLLLLFVSIGATICMVLFGFINSFTFAIILKAFSGLFGSPMWQITITIAGKLFGNNKVSFYAGIAGTISFILTFIGLSIQGYVYQKYKIWRSVYFVLGSISLHNILAIIMTMLHQRRKLKQLRNDRKVEVSWMNLFQLKSHQCSDHNGIDVQGQSGNTSGNGNISKRNKLKVLMSNPLNWYLGLYGFVLYFIFNAVFSLWVIPYLMIKFNYSRATASFLSGAGTGLVGIGALILGYSATRFKKRKFFFL